MPKDLNQEKQDIKHCKKIKKLLEREVNIELVTHYLINNNIVHLNMFFRLSEQEVFNLLKALSIPNNILSLAFRDADINDVSMEFIANFIKNNKTLNALYLPGNDIGLKGIQALREALQGNSILTHLSLRSNNIKITETECLALILLENQLVSLDIGYNSLKGIGLKNILSALKNNNRLTTLCLAANEIGDEDMSIIVDFLASNTSLEKLDLGYNKIGPKGIQSLSELLKSNDSLIQIQLEFNPLQDLGCSYIAQVLPFNKRLTHLDLRGTGLTNKSIDLLATTIASVTHRELPQDLFLYIEDPHNILPPAFIQHTLNRHATSYAALSNYISVESVAAIISDYLDDLVYGSIKSYFLIEYRKRLSSFVMPMEDDPGGSGLQALGPGSKL